MKNITEALSAGVCSLELAFRLQSLSQGLWHGWWWWSWESEGHLDTIVDEPLKSSQSTDHDDSRSETGPETLESEVLGNLTGAGAWRLVEDGYDAIGWVRDNRAEDTSDLTQNFGGNQYKMGSL